MFDYEIVQKRIVADLTSAQAVPDDIPQVTELLVGVAKWLQSRGSTQWQGLLYGDDSHQTAEAIRRGNVFLFKNGGEVAGMVMLLREPSEWDRELWGDEGHESSIYLHRLAINRAYSGQGLGEAILGWAESGIRFPGKERIRLDCIASNPVLNSFYRKMGYAYAGAAVNPHGEFSKYERRLP